MDRFFKISERGSNVRTEIMAGLTTFFAMAYIVFVNPDQVAGVWLKDLGADGAIIDKIWNSAFIASVLVAFFGTLLYAVYAKLPYAQACGMGLNSFFCTCFVAGAFFAGADIIEGYQAGAVIIFVSGLIFMFLSITGLRKYIATSLPDCLKKAISAGIGLFIALLGFKNAGLIEDNQFTFVQLIDINGHLDKGEWASFIAPALVALLGFIIIVVLAKLNVKGNVIIGILASAVLYYLFTWQVPSFNLGQIGQSFKDFGEVGITSIFKGASWSNAFGDGFLGGAFNSIVLVITFCLVDMFDTIGTLYGTATEANMLDENGDPIDVNKAMACDSIATCAGAVLGTSTCTTFVESAAGVAAGGKSGLTSLVTSLCFLACLFLSPIASVIPSCATACALIYVGVLMLKNFGAVDMKDPRSAAPAFMTLIMMPLTYSISNGIAMGAITYVLITLFTGKYTKKDIVVTLIALLFLARFIFVTM